jgi:hypothetical protein
MNKPDKTSLQVFLIGSMILVAAFVVVIATRPRPQIVDETFSIEVRDVFQDTLLDPSKFQCQVYSTNDSNMWPWYVLLQNDTLDNVVEPPPSTDDEYVIMFKGQVGNVTYPERWRFIYPGHRNFLFAAALPAFVNMTIKNASDGSIVDPRGITTQSLIVEINSDLSNPLAGYVLYYDPRRGDYVMPWIQVNYNTTVSLLDHNMVDGHSGISSLLKFRYNSTCLGFGLTTLTSRPNPVQSMFTNASTSITSIHLCWGDTILY